MKAVVINRFGPPDVLEITEMHVPQPGKEEVLIQVKAAGINPVDTKVRAGTNAIAKNISLPAVLGWDMSGVVEAAGANVTGLKKGDAVFGCIGFPGLGKTYAEYAVADPAVLARKPANISFEEAAAVPIAGLTAYQAIHDHLSLQAGQKILIQAAAGGVGHLAVQFARLTGAFIYGTASAKNEGFLKALGTDRFIDYHKEKFEEIVHQADAAIDALGGDVLYRTIGCVKKGGQVLCLPSSTRNDPRALELAAKNSVRLSWPMMAVNGEQMQLIGEYMRDKKIKVHVDKIFTLDQVAWAHKAVETHGTKGKIVVRMF